MISKRDEELTLAIVRMEGKIDGINKRLDQLNGSVAKASLWMEKHTEDTEKRTELSSARWSEQKAFNTKITVYTAILGVIGVAAVVALVQIGIKILYGG